MTDIRDRFGKEPFVIVNVCLAAFFSVLMGIASHLGWVQYVFNQDISNLSYLIVVFFVVAQVATWMRNYDLADQLGNMMIFTGLIGTVLGFMISFGNLDISRVAEAQYAQEMAGNLIYGIGTALSTTLLGSIGYLWLRLNHIALGIRK